MHTYLVSLFVTLFFYIKFFQLVILCVASCVFPNVQRFTVAGQGVSFQYCIFWFNKYKNPFFSFSFFSFFFFIFYYNVLIALFIFYSLFFYFLFSFSQSVCHKFKCPTGCQLVLTSYILLVVSVYGSQFVCRKLRLLMSNTLLWQGKVFHFTCYFFCIVKYLSFCVCIQQLVCIFITNSNVQQVVR